MTSGRPARPLSKLRTARSRYAICAISLSFDKHGSYSLAQRRVFVFAKARRHTNTKTTRGVLFFLSCPPRKARALVWLAHERTLAEERTKESATKSASLSTAQRRSDLSFSVSAYYESDVETRVLKALEFCAIESALKRAKVVLSVALFRKALDRFHTQETKETRDRDLGVLSKPQHIHTFGRREARAGPGWRPAG